MVDCEKSSNFARMILQMFRYITLSVVLMAALMLLSACSNSDDAPATPTAPTAEDNSIRFNANVWRMMDATRASFYNGGTLSGGSFKVAAYEAGETTPYINPVQVNWVTNHWEFEDGKHYWPMSGGLDFFAYMPVDPQSYITSGPGYTTARHPQFTCTMPMTNAGQTSITEFVYDLQTDQDKAHQGADGVALSFRHPFTKIVLKLSSTQTNIHIDKIIFKSIKKVGTFTHGSGWALSEDDAVNFEASLNGNYGASADLGTFLMIPQNWAGAIEVQATWTDWGEQFLHHLYATVPTNWAAGYSYTYTFTITQFDLRVDTQKFTEQW